MDSNTLTAIALGAAAVVTVAAFLTGHDGVIIPAFFGFLGGIGFHYATTQGKAVVASP